ncbi:50S ribosomal protein 6, chloroplastic [Ananas comosus]|uniref:50S ribosomal protein 6, chloroplastic n=1 Tax=Ananas comosus TaxID=4615 RepID=A0A6P5FU00_ANACO|nr:50S ribosomal protein 6, chloroplastic [Ananas comosus]
MASIAAGIWRASVVGAVRDNKNSSSKKHGKNQEEGLGPGMAVVECSSRPQKKATSHHMKTRPKKTQPWDVKRKGPTPYPPLPTLPPDWTLLDPAQPESEPEPGAEPVAAPNF